MVLGQTLAEFLLARLTGTGGFPTRTFDGRGFTGDFTYEEVLNASYISSAPPSAGASEPSRIIVTASAPLEVPGSDLLAWLWNAAVAECSLIIT